MYKRILLSILLLASVCRLNAQGINDKALFGIKGGVNFPRLHFTEINLNKLPHDFMITPTASVFYEFKVYNKLSLAVEFNYQQRGGATSYVYENDYNVNYKLLADYVSICLPLYCYLSNNEKFSPYLVIAPVFSYALGGKITLSQPGLPIPEASVDISDANINRFNFGLAGGVGVRKNAELKNWLLVLKADAVFNWGLLNTFSPSETNENATPMNVHAYNSQGKRETMGVELTLGLGFSKIGSSVRKHSSKSRHSARTRQSYGPKRGKKGSSDCYPWN